VLRYWEYQIRNGVRTRVNVHKKLAPIGPAYPDKKSVEVLAWKHLEPINTRLQTPESATPLTEFIETIYLPSVKPFLSAATYKNYERDEYQHHIKHRLGNLRLRDFRPAHGSRLLGAIAKENPKLGHKTLLRLKSFLSGVFKHARAEGYLDENPMRDVSIPRTVRRTKYRGPIYTLPEISQLLANIQQSDYHGRVAFAAVAVAAFTGLRLAELRGLQWGDLSDGRLSVRRTVWRTKQGMPKTESSENSVPVLPLLASMLALYRHYLESEEDGNLGKTLHLTTWMFAGERRGTSINLPNLVRRTIIPNLTRCEVCHAPKYQHEAISHKFKLDEAQPTWKGWKCFRRSLASNLYAMGVKPATIAAILRHSDISTTLGWYVEVPETDTRAALDKLNVLMR
jgi:integrase